MTENENSHENLRKFLLSEDPAMRLMGISMSKGVDLPESNQIVNALSYWDTNEKVKESAKLIIEKKGIELGDAIDYFADCPLWLQIKWIKNREVTKIIDDMHMFTEEVCYIVDEIIKEAPKNKKDIDDLVTHLYDNEWKGSHSMGFPDESSWPMPYELGHCMIKLLKWVDPDETLSDEILSNTTNVVDGINPEQGFADEDYHGIDESYIQIIAEFGSKDDVKVLIPLLSSELTRQEAGEALIELGMSKGEFLEHISEEELEELGYL